MARSSSDTSSLLSFVGYNDHGKDLSRKEWDLSFSLQLKIRDLSSNKEGSDLLKHNLGLCQKIANINMHMTYTVTF